MNNIQKVNLTKVTTLIAIAAFWLSAPFASGDGHLQELVVNGDFEDVRTPDENGEQMDFFAAHGKANGATKFGLDGFGLSNWGQGFQVYTPEWRGTDTNYLTGPMNPRDDQLAFDPAITGDHVSFLNNPGDAWNAIGPLNAGTYAATMMIGYHRDEVFQFPEKPVFTIQVEQSTDVWTDLEVVDPSSLVSQDDTVAAAGEWHDLFKNYEVSDASPAAGLPARVYYATGEFADKMSVDNVSVKFGAATQTWAGYPVDANGWVDTTPWLAFINVSAGDWVWVVNLGTYIYLPEEFVSEAGAWTYIPN
jgi:hypothetical protein